MNRTELKALLTAAFREDIGMGDLTTEALFPMSDSSKGAFIAKEEGIVAGTPVMECAYSLLSDEVSVHPYRQDGNLVAPGQVIAEVEGPVRVLLSAERVILNLVQHLSGIATATAEVIDRLDDPSVTITDTRKTLPGLRALQKYAVTCGGGKNHRFRLDDGVMIKDNHIKAAGSIQKAVELVREKIGHMVKVEVEVETKEQVEEAVSAGADVIMLDNRSPEEVRELAGLIPASVIVEVSGGITPDNIHEYKNCGANVISLGWLTHSVKALDISFNLIRS